MQYIDTGTRDSAHALGAWLCSLKPKDVRGLRWQSGYFSADGLAPLVPLIQTLSKSSLPISCVVGSNGGETGQRDIEVLTDLIGCPRADARIAVVSYATGLYHPKIYHVTRFDGSQTAYVGSANLTSAGVTGLNIEAGLILDTVAGDAVQVLAEISSAVDAWFDGSREGVASILRSADIPPLVDGGHLGATSAIPAPRPASATPSGAATGKTLKPLVNFPSVPGVSTAPISSAQRGSVTPAPPGTPAILAPSLAAATAAALPSTPRSSFPPYVLLAPGATTPTQGAAALTGSLLPGGAAGLVIRLNKDSARHFAGKTGTSNVSIPVATIGTLRFGIFQGKYQRPRAEFELLMRYVFPAGMQNAQPHKTNVMVYGHVPGESGHGDIRMVVPVGPAREIRDFAEDIGPRIPLLGDPMILEWPTSADPSFRATICDANVPLFDTLNDMLTSAENTGQLVGQGACWLPPGVSPRW